MSPIWMLHFLIMMKNSRALELFSTPAQPVLGNDFNLTCNIQSLSIPIVSFQSNNIPICGVHGSTGICDKSSQCETLYIYTCIYPHITMTIPSFIDINIFHGTSWTCRDDYIYYHASNRVTLFVRVPIASVSITPSSAEIHIGQNHTFICKTDAGRPQARIQWYLSDGTNLTDFASQEKDCGTTCNVKVNSTSVLLYQADSTDHGKMLRCLANNVEDREVTSQNVTINIVYGPFIIAINPSTYYYVINETNTIGPISCKADCRPNCTITWTGPNVLGEESDELYIQNVNRSHAGEYFCSARNSVGSKTSGKLTVVINYVPIITRIEGKSTYSENETAHHQCHVDSVPESVVRWLFVDHENRTTVVANGSLLTLLQMSCVTMGLYVCEAKNMLGMTKRSVNISVLCSPRLNLIEKDISQKIYVNENQPLTLTALLLAYPKPWICWQILRHSVFKNISCAKGSESSSIRHTSTFFIQKITHTDFGTYAIFAENGIQSESKLIGAFEVLEVIPESPIGVAAGIGIGVGISTVIFIISVVVFLIVRRKNTDASGPTEVYEGTECRPTSANVYEDMDNDIKGVVPNKIGEERIYMNTDI